MARGRTVLEQAEADGGDHSVLDIVAARIRSAGPGSRPDISDLFDIVCEEVAPRRLNQLLRHLRDNPETKALLANRKGLSLGIRPEFAIDVSTIGHRATHLYWYPRHAWYRVLSGCADVTVYRVPATAKPDIVDPQLALEYCWTREFARGGTFTRDGRSDVLDIAPTGRDPVVLLRLHALKTGGLEWMFDKATLRPVGATAADPNDSHLINLIYALSQIGGKESVGAIEEVASHSAHFVRWGAIQAIGRLSRQKGLQALAAGLDDSHPHISGKARAILDRLRTGGAGS